MRAENDAWEAGGGGNDVRTWPEGWCRGGAEKVDVTLIPGKPDEHRRSNKHGRCSNLAVSPIDAS
ncbi:hypothetical protein J6590_001952 [Homalodisca vitripennis]|nr:hypothetical protein J6590_001952 [Homalodisca vitripennis]